MTRLADNRWLRRTAPAAALIVAFRISPSRAQESDVERLYRQALREKDAGSYASACVKLEQVVRLRTENGKLPARGLGAQIELASCYQAQGRLATAHAQYERVRAIADREGQRERARKAAQGADALKPRLARLAIKVPASTASISGLSVTLDGDVVGTFDAGVPVDAGTHIVLVTAPGRGTRKIEIAVPTDGITIEVYTALPPHSPRPDAPGTGSPPTAPVAGGWYKPFGYGVIALGSAGLAMSGMLGIAAIQKSEESNRGGHCDSADSCDTVGLPLRTEAVTLANASTGLFVGSIAALASGLFIAFALPSISSKGRPAGLQSTIACNTDACAFSLGGRW